MVPLCNGCKWLWSKECMANAIAFHFKQVGVQMKLISIAIGLVGMRKHLTCVSVRYMDAPTRMGYKSAEV